MRRRSVGAHDPTTERGGTVMEGNLSVLPDGTATLADEPSREARPSLLTRTFLTVAAAELAYFTADGVLLPALPRYVEGPLGGGNVAVGIVIGAFSVTAFSAPVAERWRTGLPLSVAGPRCSRFGEGYLVATSSRPPCGADGTARRCLRRGCCQLDLAPPNDWEG
jgi:hypothetical protein